MIFRRAAMREFAGTTAALFVALFLILLTMTLIRMLSQAAGGRIPADALLALIGFSTLNHLPVALALAVFVGVLLSIGRSYRDSEMVVWFVSGMPLTGWVGPVLRFTLPLAIVIAGMSIFLSPWAQEKAAEYRKRLENRDDVTRVAPGVFRESLGSQRVFFVEAASPDQGRIRNIFIDTRREGRQSVTVAAEGMLETADNGDRFLVLLDGRHYQGLPGEARYQVTEFKRHAIRIDPKELGVVEQQPRLMPTHVLLASPLPAGKGELVWRFGIPLATVMLALLAIPLAFVNPRAGRANNLIFAVLTFSIYFNLLGVAQAWVAQGRVGYVEGMWGVHGLMALLLLILFAQRMIHSLKRRRA